MSNLVVYVVGHKEFTSPKNDCYIPIQVGKKFTKKELPMISDDTGINIAEKNKTYCELTALYWIWKNLSDIEYIGLCHYRRYFYKYHIFGKTFGFMHNSDYKKLLCEYDILLPKKNVWDYSVRECYSGHGAGKDKDIIELRNVIEEKYPDYVSDFDKILNGNSASYCNMMVSNRQVLNAYCSWLFDILFDLENRIDLTGYTLAEARIYGYLSEILLNVWVEHNQLRVGELFTKIKEY